MSVNNLEQLESIFRDSLGLEQETQVRDLTYRSIEEWDSVAHMVLIADIEDVFGVMLETDDVIELSSFSNAILILGKHGIVFDS
jgi:acyl carrier protein